jgi:hypothetical protein
MHSFDLFNTLVTSRRNLNAGEVPVDHHFAIAENIARVQPDDIVVSDYHDAAKAQRILTEVCGLSNRLICTEDGKATGAVWKDVKPEHHLGDNVYTDFDSPRRHGIRAEITTLAQLTARERACGQLGWAMREARLRTWSDNPTIRALQLYQIERNLPFLLKAAELINQKIKTEGFTRVLLCSRDCFLLYQTMKWLYAYMREYEIEYFCTSRLTRYRPSETYTEYAKERLSGKTLVVDLNGSGNSLKYLTDMFGGTPLLVVGSSNVVPSLIRGGLRETANLAPHSMVVDVQRDENGKWQPLSINPTGQNWTKPAIVEPQDVFRLALECLSIHEVTTLPYSLADALRYTEHESLEPLWADHFADSQAAFELLNAGPLPHAVVL